MIYLLAVFGLVVGADVISAIAIVLWVALVELASSRAGLLVSQTGVQRLTDDQEKTPEPSATEHPAHPDGNAVAKDKVVALLQNDGGQYRSGQRGLGKLIEVSTTRVNQIISELANEGRIIVNATRAGTELRLA